MRSLLASALVLLAACGSSDAGDDSSAHGAPSVSASGPDPIVLRVPRTGGSARAYVYPALDSVVWRSGGTVPGIARVLAFDPDGGLLAYVDAKGRPIRLDLRAGAAAATGGKATLVRLASADGSDIYGLDGTRVARLTPAGGAWPFQAPAGVREVIPQPDGDLVVVAARRDSTLVWRVRPPDTRLLDTAALPRTRAALGTQLGDRVYFVGESTLHALRSRDLQPAPSITLDGRIVDMAATPSGDRLYVTLAASPEIQVIDRYRDEVVGTIELPTPADSLRMDALGRYLLARAGDSAFVVALGTGRASGAQRTAWRADLPFVAPDGAVALARGADVVFVDAETFAVRRTVAGGTSDYWHLVLWNGFRPRAKGLDEPVVFAQRDTTDTLSVGEPIDTSAFAGVAVDTTPVPRVAEPAPRPALPPTGTTPAAPATDLYTLSFATLRDEGDARKLAGRIEIDGERARVVPSTVAGTPIFRVVMGPFRSKADAERRGKASGRDFWVYAGTP